MMRPGTIVLSLCALCAATPAPLEERNKAVSGLVSGVLDGVDGFVRGLLGNLDNAVNRGDRDEVIDILRQVKPSKGSFTTTEEAFSRVRDIAHQSGKDLNIFDFAAQLMANGLISGTVDGLFDYVQGFSSNESSSNNK
jgi:hypothetical protein